MKPKGKLEVAAHSPHDLRSQCKRQTSAAELEEARKRGCYRVLPPVSAPHEKEPTMSELLQEIDEAVLRAVVFY